MVALGARRPRLPLSLTSLSLSQRYRGTESVGEYVTALYVELALLTLFELLDEIDDLAATSREEFAAKENPVPRAWLVLATHGVTSIRP